MSVHHRQQLNFTFEGLEAAKNGLQRIDDFLARLEDVDFRGEEAAVEEVVGETREAFLSEMDSDLNISGALGKVFDLIHWANQQMDEGSIGVAGDSQLRSFLQELDAVLGILPEKVEIDPEVQRLADEREKARKQKNYALADEIREKVRQMGYILEDTPKGVRIKRVT
jgi:cysteinyl-tRNA synthetase